MSHVPTRVRAWWSDGLQAMGALVLPWECPICGAEPFLDSTLRAPDSPFCQDCRAELLDAAGDTCARCAMPVGPYARKSAGRGPASGCGDCRGRPLGFDAAYALAPYQGPVRELCLSLKHKANGWIAPWLAEVLVDARPGLLNEAQAESGAVVVAVPLHWRRHWERGYNQSEELARGLASRLGLPTIRPLRRTRPTAKLAGIGRVERGKLLRGAFQASARGARAIQGRNVLLVDDVLTTGATCGAAARALKQAGARRVVAAVIARTEGHR